MSTSASLSSTTNHSLLPSEISEVKSMLKSKSRKDINFKQIDIQKIRKNLYKAAEGGCAHAYYLLGKISHIGLGVPQDILIAKLFYTLGKDANDSACIRGLERLLRHVNAPDKYNALMKQAQQMEKGIDCDINLTGARKLYKEAAKLGNCVQAASRYILLSDILDLFPKMPVEIELLERASILGIKEVSYALAVYFGDILESERGIDYLILAANQKEPQAMYRLGCLYGMGTDLVPIDTLSSMAWLKAAGEAGHAKAYAVLGKIYQNKGGEYEDPERAQEYFDKAKNLGYDISKISDASLSELSISSLGDETQQSCVQ